MSSSNQTSASFFGLKISRGGVGGQSPTTAQHLTRRALLCSGTMAALAGCGFTPVHGPGGTDTANAPSLRGAILADAPADRNAFVFVGQFEERLGRATTAPRYHLRYTIRTRRAGVGITPARETTRFNLFGVVDYVVIDAATDAVATKGLVENFVGFSATSLIVSTQAAERDANERLMVILADQIVTRLLATAPDWAE